MKNRLFIGIKGHVVCLDRKTGNELWRQKLRSSSITNVVLDQGMLYAFARGHLYALKPQDGAVVWENKLPGLGYGPCIIASQDAQAAATVVSQEVLNQQARAASAAAAT